MMLSDVMAEIRAAYVAKLAKAIAGVSAHVEPAYRHADGSLVCEGAFGLPCRADLILREVDVAGGGAVVSVDSDAPADRKPCRMDGRTDARVSISRFVWDWATIEIAGLADAEAGKLLCAWFLEWFDGDDRHGLDEDGLYGVVHYMSDPLPTANGLRATMDLGSAPVAAVDALVALLLQAGASEIRIR